MENTSNNARRAIAVIILEIVIAACLILAILFFFKMIPFNSVQVSADKQPISPNITGVNLAIGTYYLTGQVGILIPDGNDKFKLTLKNIPNQVFEFSKNAKVQKIGSNVEETVGNIKQGDAISIRVNYDFKKKKWSFVPALPPGFQSVINFKTNSNVQK